MPLAKLDASGAIDVAIRADVRRLIERDQACHHAADPLGIAGVNEAALVDRPPQFLRRRPAELPLRFAAPAKDRSIRCPFDHRQRRVVEVLRKDAVIVQAASLGFFQRRKVDQQAEEELLAFRVDAGKVLGTEPEFAAGLRRAEAEFGPPVGVIDGGLLDGFVKLLAVDPPDRKRFGLEQRSEFFGRDFEEFHAAIGKVLQTDAATDVSRFVEQSRARIDGALRWWDVPRHERAPYRGSIDLSDKRMRPGDSVKRQHRFQACSQ